MLMLSPPRCILPYSSDPARYGAAALSKGYAPCEKSVVKVLRDLLERSLDYARSTGSHDDFIDAELNARLVHDAERYYRLMYYVSIVGHEQVWLSVLTYML
jgi:erythromycin esterase-like protein